MSLNSFFQFFVPKEKKFYPLYIQQADFIEKASKLLYRMINETDLQNLEELKKEIKACETSGDDVHELAEMMDTFLDRIDDCANIILTRRFTDVDEDLTTMTENIMFAAESLCSICRDLEFMNNNGKSKEIGRLCQEIKTIEHDNDELYGNYIHKLFEQNYTLTEIIKRKDLVQVLENTTNSVKYISDKIRSIISKL